MKTFTATNEEADRLDRIAAELSGLTRSQVQKAVKAGLVLLNEEAAPVKALVESGDVISFDDSLFEVVERDKTPRPLNIIYEDADVIVINKPAGLLVHDAPGNTDSVLTDSLLAHHPAIAEVGDPHRPGIVHRLDKDTSGILIVAKTPAAYGWLKGQFMERETVKKYTTLVMGVLDKLHDTINFTISRSKSHGRMAAKPPSQGGKEAITHYTVIKQYTHHTLCDVTIETGRTHQIRVHFFALNHPVVGDTLYRVRGQKLRDIGRLFLHARELTITLPSQERMTFEAELPQELEAVLEDVAKE